MKSKLSLLLSFLVFGILFSQKSFHFDYRLKYKIEENKKSKEIVFFVNSKDPSYVLRIIEINNGLQSNLISLKDKKFHTFSVKHDKLNNDSYYFVYESSAEFIRRSNIQTPFFKIAKMDNDVISLDFFKDKNLEKRKAKYLLKLIPNEDLGFDIYRLMLLHPFEEIDLLAFPGNFIVSETEIILNNGKKAYKKLIEYKKINISIHIPEN